MVIVLHGSHYGIFADSARIFGHFRQIGRYPERLLEPRTAVASGRQLIRRCTKRKCFDLFKRSESPSHALGHRYPQE